jgi:general secretion pathway protein L
MNCLVIQLAAGEAVFARFARRGGNLAFLKAERHELTEETPLPALLSGLKEDAQSRVILSIPASQLFFREVEIPISDRKKLRELLPMELKGETALDADELLFDSIPVAEGRVLAVWCRKSYVAEQIALLAEHGLEPEVVTSALLHWQQLLPNETGRTVAITDGEAVAFFGDGTPLFFRALAGGRRELDRTIAAVEAAKETALDALYLHGPVLRGTREEWPGEPLPPKPDMAALFAEAGASLALASSYAVVRDCLTGNPVNFRQRELAYTAGDLRLRKKLMLTAGLAALLVVLTFGELGLRYFLAKRDLDSLNGSIRTMYRQIFPDRKKPVDEVSELRSEIRRLGGSGQGATVLPLLKKVAELKTDDIAGIYEVEIEGGQLRLKGDARSVQAVNDFRARSAALFGNPELGEVKSRPDGSVSFVFRATPKGGEK